MQQARSEQHQHGLWHRRRLPPELGECFVDWLDFEDGLSLVYADYRPQQALCERSQIERSPALTVALALEGRSTAIDDRGQQVEFVSGHSTIASYARLRGERRFPAHTASRQLRLVVSADWLAGHGLRHLLPSGADSERVTPLYSGRHGRHIRQLADSLLHLRTHGGNLLDIHAAALCLLGEQLRPLLPPPVLGSEALARQQLVRQARELMLAHYAQPLRIAWLCRQLGTNECRLKQSFRHAAGLSPHRMLQTIRMQKAWELLQTGLHVATVAYQVGFRHPTSFSAAFQCHFGCPPRSVRAAGGPQDQTRP